MTDLETFEALCEESRQLSMNAEEAERGYMRAQTILGVLIALGFIGIALSAPRATERGRADAPHAAVALR